jgi:hypothetical protein
MTFLLLILSFSAFSNSLKNVLGTNEVILIGDTNHYSKALKHFYYQVAELASKQSKKQTCLLVEADVRYNKEIERLTAGFSYEDTINNLHTLMARNANLSIERVNKKSYLLETKVKEFLKKNIEVFTIDMNFSGMFGREVARRFAIYQKNNNDIENNTWLAINVAQKRNEFMAKNILKAKYNGCKKIIAVMGNGHLLSNANESFAGYQGEKILSVSEILETEQQNSIKILAGAYTCTHPRYRTYSDIECTQVNLLLQESEFEVSKFNDFDFIVSVQNIPFFDSE